MKKSTMFLSFKKGCKVGVTERQVKTAFETIVKLRKDLGKMTPEDRFEFSRIDGKLHKNIEINEIDLVSIENLMKYHEKEKSKWEE